MVVALTRLCGGLIAQQTRTAMKEVGIAGSANSEDDGKNDNHAAFPPPMTFGYVVMCFREAREVGS